MKDIVIPRSEFIREHKSLTNLLLKAGKEGAKQKKELKEVMGNGKPTSKFMKDVMKAYRGSGQCQTMTTGIEPGRPPPAPIVPRPIAEIRRILEHPEPNDIPLTLIERLMYERAEAVRLSARHYNEPYNYPSIDITFDDPTEGSGRRGGSKDKYDEYQREVDERVARMIAEDAAERKAAEEVDYATRQYQRAIEKYNRQRLGTKRKQKKIGRRLAPIAEGEGEGAGNIFRRAAVAPAEVENRFNENLANPGLVNATYPEMRQMAEFNYPGGQGRYDALVALRGAMVAEQRRVQAAARLEVARAWVARFRPQPLEPRIHPEVMAFEGRALTEDPVEVDEEGEARAAGRFRGGARLGLMADEDLMMMAIDDNHLNELRRARDADMAEMMAEQHRREVAAILRGNRRQARQAEGVKLAKKAPQGKMVMYKTKGSRGRGEPE